MRTAPFQCNLTKLGPKSLELTKSSKKKLQPPHAAYPFQNLTHKEHNQTHTNKQQQKTYP